MKTVTFTRAEPGIHVGDQRTVPDALAATLVANGLATARPFPDGAPQAPQRAVCAPERPVLHIGRKARR